MFRANSKDGCFNWYVWWQKHIPPFNVLHLPLAKKGLKTFFVLLETVTTTKSVHFYCDLIK